MGYSLYFVFVLGALNTLTLTFYLTIDNYPELGGIFPSFASYILIVCMIGIPVLVLTGYVHIRRSNAYRSEIETVYESSPYLYKLPPGIHKEIMAPFLYETLLILKKMDAGDALSEEETAKMQDLDKNLDLLLNGGVLKRPKDFSGL